MRDRPAPEHPPFMVVGHLNKPHGRKGEVFAWPLTDYPDSHFAPGAAHLRGDDEAERPAEGAAPLVVESVRPYRKGFLVKFEGVDDRESAEELRGAYLLRPFETIDELRDGEIFYHELLGAAVATSDGEELGEVAEVFQLRPADLLQVLGPRGEVMIPVIPQIVTGFDRERRRVVVDLPDGLIE